MRRIFLRFFFSLIAAAAFVLANGSPASAHNTFVDSAPRDGDALAASPTTWTLTFAKAVPLQSASGSVINGDGVRIPLGSPRHGTTDSVIVFDFPTGLSGGITARWQLVSSDGHVISGRVSFVVQSGVDGEQATPLTLTGVENEVSDSAGVPDPIRAGIRFGNYAALVLLGGLLFVDLDIATGALQTIRGRRFSTWGVAVIAIAPLFQFLILVDDINGNGEGFFAAVGDALSLTAGAMLLMRVAIGGTLAYMVYLLLGGRSTARSMMPPLAAAAVMYLVTLAYVGHSRSQSLPVLGIPLDVMHTAAVTVWLGGLASMILVVVPSVDATQAIGAFNRFGPAAQRAVGVIAITGVIQTLRLHGNPGSLVTSTHGLLLLGKVVLVGLMIRLAARNRRVLQRHRVAAIPNDDRAKTILLRTTTTEVLLGCAVIALTAILVAVTPG